MTYVMTAQNRSGARAITFIELLVVVIILSVFIGVSAPQFRKSFEGFEAENFIKNIYYLASYLQNSAISQGRIYCLNIAPGEGKFWVTNKIGDRFEPSKERFTKASQAPGGLKISFVPDKAEQASIYFYPDGSVEQITIAFEDKYSKKVYLDIKGTMGGIKIR